MVRRDVALVAEEQMYFIPRDLRAQRWIVAQEAVERLRGRSPCQHYVKGAFLAPRGCRGLNELLGRAPCDGCSVRQDSNLTQHAPLSGDDSRLVRSGNPAALFDFLFPDAPPRPAIAFQQFVC